MTPLRDIVIELRGWLGSPVRALHTMMKAADEIERLRARIDANAIEYDRLLSRCAALERVRQQAQALVDYEDAGPDDPAGKSWMHYWEEKFEALRDALKEAPQ